MEYYNEVLDRRDGELVTVSMGDWITVTELGDLYGVGRRKVRTILRAMGALHLEGPHRRHRIANWALSQGWGKRIEKNVKQPFDVIGPAFREWIAERWEATLAQVDAEALAAVIAARAALEAFNQQRLHGPLTVQQSVSWLTNFFPHLSQSEKAAVLDVSQPLVARYDSIRGKKLKEARLRRTMDLDEFHPGSRKKREVGIYLIGEER